MAAIANEIDRLLNASPAPSDPPVERIFLLNCSSPGGFKVAANGSATPASIIFTALRFNMPGTVTFSASDGATLAVNGDEATLSYSDMPGANCTVTASITDPEGVLHQRPVTISKVSDGADGDAGPPGAQYAVARLYRWTTTAPAKPVGTSTFAWSSGANDSYNGADGWSATVPANPGTPSIALYVASAPISAASGTASSTVSYSAAVVEAWAQNGSNGASGVQSAQPTVYQWAATIPAGPAGSASYKWSDGTFGAAPSGWSLTPGTSPSAGMTLWAARVNVTDSAANATTSFNWTAASIVAAGYAGTDGTGQNGTSYVTAYCASSTGNATSAPAQTTGKASLPAANSGGITGTWSSTVPTLGVGQYLYQTDGIYDPATNLVTWSIPYWSSLKVGSLSAISANLGQVTAGSIDIGTGSTSWHVDSLGNTWAGAATYGAAPFRVSNGGAVVASNLTLTGAGGATVIDPTGLKAGYEAPGTKNSDFNNGTLTIGGDNLAPNSSFERMTNGLADGYGIYNNDPANEPTSASEGAGRNGGRAQIISWTGNHQSTKGVLGTVCTGGWVPGKTYVLSFWARTSSLQTAGGMFLAWNTAPTVAEGLLNPVLGLEWKRYAFRIVWGASVESNGGAFISVHIGAGAGNVWFDDLMAAEGDVLTAYAPSAAEAQSAADAANLRLANIAADNKLTKEEKRQTIHEFQLAGTGFDDLIAKADAVGVSRTAYYDAKVALNNYLDDYIGAGFNDASTDSDIDGPTYRAKFADLYQQKQLLINAITAKAQSTADAANNGLADKLSKSAGGVLAGRVTLQTSGGIVAGDLTWDNAGLRTGGKGTAMTPYGIVTHNGTRYTFVLEGSTGIAQFGGTLDAPSGTFGAVSIASGGSFSSGQTAYDTGSGWWMGYVGGVPKFSIGTTGGGALLWDGTDLIARKIKFDALSATISGTLPTSVANGPVDYGSLTVSASGGTVQSYDWSITFTSATGVATSYGLSAGAGTATASFRGNATNMQIQARITCLVTFSDGRTTSVSRNHNVTHGTYQA